MIFSMNVRWPLVALLLAVLGNAPVAAQEPYSCEIDNRADLHFQMYGMSLWDDGMYRPMSRWIYALANDGSTNDRYGFRIINCERGTLSVFAPPAGRLAAEGLRRIGSVDGQDVYDIGVPGIGLQLRGGYLGSYFSRPGGGSTQEFELAADYVNGEAPGVNRLSPPGGDNQRTLRRNLQVRFVRMGPLAAGWVDFPGIFIGTDTIAGAGELQVSYGVHLDPSRILLPAARCNLAYGAGTAINLGTIPSTDMDSIGAGSALHAFDWVVSCVGGLNRTVKVTYESLTPVTDAAAGRAQIAGTASGVELEVRRGISAGQPEGVPVAFGTTVPLGNSWERLTERMAVRLVRVGNISAGTVTGGININVSYD